QHNPVDWYPWGPEALARAKAENRPIFLSIGYSACHWCHVMAHESFEDPASAAVMNEMFVNIKVDREERPDVDQIYQQVHGMMNRRSGGWPLTIFMTPEQKPFFAATYVPKEPRYGMMAFTDLCRRIAEAYQDKQDAIAHTTQSIIEVLQQSTSVPESASRMQLRAHAEQALNNLLGSFDARHGGFGTAPKFLHPMELRFCLEQGMSKKRDELLHLALHSLMKMAEGGLFDQLGGGFARYSVDAEWSIPHFEKMLYDNGQLLSLYADAWRLCQDMNPAAHARAAMTLSKTIAWLQREMLAAEHGGFYAALDADSEGEEGKFYVWTPETVQALVPADCYADFAAYYGLHESANFEGHAWHLRVRGEVSTEAQWQHIQTAEQALLAARQLRVRPGTDDKLLTGWNALLVSGLARAARVASRDDWLSLAQNAMDFIAEHCFLEGRLFAMPADNNRALNAYLDDHAFCLEALIELLQCAPRAKDVALAKTIADALLRHFADEAQGGFYFTRHDHEALIARSKPAHDNATPSGNGVAAHSLIILGHLLAEPAYISAAERTVQAFAAQMHKYPEGFCSLHRAAALLQQAPTVVVITGPDKDAQNWQRSLEAVYAPERIVICQGAGEALPVALHKPYAPTHVQAFVCRGTACLPPVTVWDKLLVAIGEKQPENLGGG
ncbi:MAG: hypothetical protein RLZZ502_430, partial [Pseudomonadota bacterium]